MFKRNSSSMGIFRVNTEFKKYFEEVAQSRGMQFSEAVREAMRLYVNKYNKKGD